MIMEGNHFGEGGGVHACVVGVADFSGALVGMGHQAVDECRLASAGVAGGG